MKSTIFVTCLLISVLFTCTCHSAIIAVHPGDSLQAAVDNALPGDRIEISEGVYDENISITKPVTLKAEGNVELNARGKESGILLDGTGISIEGLNIRHSMGTGIIIGNDSENIRITGNTISENNGNGIDIWIGKNSTITENIISNNNGNGVFLGSSDASLVERNRIGYNNGNGIFGGIENGIIRQNSFIRNNEQGMVLLNSMKNRVQNNIMADNKETGLSFIFGSENIISDNEISNNPLSGISLLFSWENGILNNSISNSYNGLFLGNSSEKNIIAENDVKSNVLGILISSSNENVIRNNSYSDNQYDTFDDGSNYWQEDQSIVISHQ